MGLPRRSSPYRGVQVSQVFGRTRGARLLLLLATCPNELEVQDAICRVVYGLLVKFEVMKGLYFDNFISPLVNRH